MLGEACGALVSRHFGLATTIPAHPFHPVSFEWQFLPIFSHLRMINHKATSLIDWKAMHSLNPPVSIFHRTAPVLSG